VLLTVKGGLRFREVSDPDLPWLRHLVQLALEIGEAADLVEVSFVDDPSISALNKEYRGRDTATDVLSFHYGREAVGLAGPEDDPVGEIIISVETARRQAILEKHTCEEEISVLVIHGLHHIMGYDHEVPEDAAKMLKAEEPWRLRVNGFFSSEGDDY
jgi:probable rRNA maturation factor